MPGECAMESVPCDRTRKFREDEHPCQQERDWDAEDREMRIKACQHRVELDEHNTN